MIDAITSSVDTTPPGGVVQVRVEARDPDCAGGTCTTGCGAYLRADLTDWTASGGTIASQDNGGLSSPYVATAGWQAPAVEGTYTVTVSLSDSGTSMCGGRNTVAGQIRLLVSASGNHPPVVRDVTAHPGQVHPGQSASLDCHASDPDGDALSYSWSADSGSVSGSGASATFVGSQPGLARVTCVATDAQGAWGDAGVVLSVSDALPEARLVQRLSAPRRAAVDSLGDVFVVDPGLGGLGVLSLASGAFVYELPLRDATSVAVDWQDRLLVGGAGGARLVDRAGRLLLDLTPPEPLGGVADVAVDGSRQRYGVLYGDAGRVLVYDADGALVALVGQAGDAPEQLRRPQGLAFTPQGELVVADGGHALVKVFGLDGTLLRSFGGNGASAGKFVRLDDVEVDGSGVIYASDAFQAWVQAFNPDGSLREVIGTYGDGAGQFKTPAGLTVATTHARLVVASLNTPSLEVFRLAGAAPPPSLPAPILSATALDFGAQAVGSGSPAETVTLSNAGEAPLGLRGLVLNGEFAQANDCGAFLDPGQSCSFSLRFSPETPGAAQGGLALETSANPSLLRVALSGQAFVPAAATLDVAQLRFAGQRVGTSSEPRLVRLTNRGGVALTGLSISAGADFAVIHACGAALPAGQSCTLGVHFAPLTVGAVAGELRVESDAANGPQVVALSGQGLAPRLVAQPATLEFGSWPKGSPVVSREMLLANGGPLPVAVLALGLSGATHFSVEKDDCSGHSLPAGASCGVVLAFDPIEVGLAGGRLLAATGPDDAQDVAGLSGTGLPTDDRELLFQDGFETGDLSAWSLAVPPDPVVLAGAQPALPPFEFGSLTVGAERTRVVTVRNPSETPLTVHAVSVLTPGAGFRVSSDACSGQDLPGGAACRVTLVFAPLEAGRTVAEVEVSSTAGRDTLVVAGTGRPAVRKAKP